MAGLAEEIERISPGDFHGSMDTVPQETRHIILLYHQCVIIATRPLLLSVLKERLEKLGHEEEDWQKFLTLPKSLMSIGIKSAEKTLQTLSGENAFVGGTTNPVEHRLTRSPEVFLPCDLEFAFAAALHLTMGNTLFPPDTGDTQYHQMAHSILDEMIASGNRVAEIRKNELQRLESLFHELDNRVKQEGLRTLTLPTLSGYGEDPKIGVENSFQEEHPEIPLEIEPGVIPSTLRTDQSLRPISSAEEQMQGNLDSFYSSMGISSYEFLSIADQIGSNDISFGLLDPDAGWSDGYEVQGLTREVEMV
ncbi:hypothetical protein PHISCL_05578 [Aspergillus sclerotialis]|uniref:Uncharacterized protein n=1 Tax=Aspergillus sclerotialis TaxID=2070753 RepID=A0A3A2ZG38_9EURO|nr:hypothetical protein PHISCL_05578 [Aspergillus sclerotialis]